MCLCSGSDGRHAGGDLLEGEDGDRGGERAHRVGAAPRAALGVEAPRLSATRAIRATRPLVPYLRTCLTPPVRPRLPPPRIPGDDYRTQRTLCDTTHRIAHASHSRLVKNIRFDSPTYTEDAFSEVVG